MKKIFGIVSIVVVLAVVVAVIIIALRLDDIVKNNVAIYGPKIVKVPVSVDEVHIALVAGSVKITRLIVGNPPGYKTPDAIRIGTASVGVNVFSLLSQKIVVRSIVLKSPEITFEGGLASNNLRKILDNVNGTAQKGGPVVTNAVGKPKPAKKFEVDDFRITGATVHVHLTDLGGQEATIPLPDIHLTDLGKNADGITASDLSRRVFAAIVASTLKAVTAEATNIGNTGQLKNVGTGVVNKIKKLGGLFKK
ncbi:MAG: hypothetical protein ACREFE_05845 [Limisphaerales bacterium]